MKINTAFSLTLALYFFGLLVQAADLQALEKHLLADRIGFLATTLGDNLHKKNHTELSEKVHALTPELILRQNLTVSLPNAAKAKSAEQELNAIKELLSLKDEREQKALMEAFAMIDVFTLRGFDKGWSIDHSQARKDSFDQMIPEATETAFEDVTPHLNEWTKDGMDIMLDVGAYVSTRMTRAVFWEAGLQKRDLEIHYGSDNEAKYRVLRRGGKFVGEVKTSASNYNKIYLVEYPSGKSSYVLTRVYGLDRAKHLALQALVLPLNGQSMASQGSKVSIFGSLEKSRDRLVKKMDEDVANVPSPDLLIVGQRGTIEGFFMQAMNLQNRETIVKLPEFLSLGQKEKEEFEQIMKAPLSHLNRWDDFGPLLAAMKKVKVNVVPSFAIQYPSHDVSDYLIKASGGAVLRVRMVENVWGDEMVPIVTALQNSKPKKIVYIGTAGAFPNKGLKVGDIISPKFVYINESTKLPLRDPEFKFPLLKRISENEQHQAIDLELVNVFSLFAETRPWFERVSKQGSAVEVEISHVRPIMPDVQVYLMISDIIGSETEDLSANSSEARQLGRNMLLTEIFSRYGMISPEVPTLKPSSSVDSSFVQLASAKFGMLNSFLVMQKAQCGNQDVMDLALKEHPFKDSDLLTRLQKMELIFEDLQDKGFLVSVESSLLNGTWNPNQPLAIQVVAQKGNQILSNTDLATLQNGFFALNTQETVTLAPLQLNRSLANEILENYSQQARANAGISIRANPSGEYKAYKIYGKTRFESAKCQAD